MHINLSGSPKELSPERFAYIKNQLQGCSNLALRGKDISVIEFADFVEANIQEVFKHIQTAIINSGIFRIPKKPGNVFKTTNGTMVLKIGVEIKQKSNYPTDFQCAFRFYLLRYKMHIPPGACLPHGNGIAVPFEFDIVCDTDVQDIKMVMAAWINSLKGLYV